MPTSSADAREQQAHLRLSGVAAGYGRVPVIRDVNLTVGLGEVVAVVGPNGAGKSTLLKAVLGIIVPSVGSITLAGEAIDGLRTDQITRRGVGYVPQVKDVFETLTVKENLEMGGYTLARDEVSDRMDEVMHIYPALATMSHRQGGYLSGGERKMLAVGRVLMRRPSLLVLDEPTAGLSPQLAHELFGHVTRLAGSGIAVLLVEQHAREALGISQWGYLMAAGQVQLAESASAFLGRPDIGDIFLGRVVDPPTASGTRPPSSASDSRPTREGP